MSNPYGQPQDPSGQPVGAYGTPPPTYGYAPRDPDRRPTTVTAAVITTIASSALVALIFMAIAIALAVSRDDIIDAFRTEFDDQDVQRGMETTTDSTSAVIAVLVVITLVVVVWSIIAIVLAVLAMRRHNWARITLVVSSGVAALVSLFLIGTLVTIVTLAAAVAAIVLLFTGGANEWYAAKNGPPQAPGQVGPPTWGA